MAPKIQRRKQTRKQSGHGSLTWIGVRGVWVVKGHVKRPDGTYSRPILHRFDKAIQSRAEAEAAFERWCNRQSKEKAALRASVRTVDRLAESFAKQNPKARPLYLSTARQWSNMQGRLRLDEYHGDHFRAFRDALDADAAKGGPTTGTKTREGVNAKLKAVRYIVQWGISQRLVDPGLGAILRAVEPLRKGKSDAPEGEGRRACSVEQFDAMVEWLPDRWADVAIVQRWGGGARPSEILSLHRDELRQVDGLWVAVKQEHKTACKGFAREIVFSPPAAPVIERLLAECTDADPWLFSPRRWEIARHRARGEAESAAGTLGDYPNHSAYRKAVDYACDTACGAAGLTKAQSWKITPYQICHLRLGEIDAALGKEHARATRGHSAATMTANYTKDADAEKNRRLAIEAAGVGCGD